jgi:hypothetical protein
LEEVRVIIEERRVSPRSDFINDRVNALNAVVRAARRVAEPIGPASTRGRPLVWRASPERMKERSLFLGAGAGDNGQF